MKIYRHPCKQVNIKVNGESIDIHMKLDENGEAFFVQNDLELKPNVFPESPTTSSFPSETCTSHGRYEIN